MLRNDAQIEVPVEQVMIGERGCRVRPGERMPVDGVVMKGSSSIDQSPITGESIPVHKEFNDPVFAGTINGFLSTHRRSEQAGIREHLEQNHQAGLKQARMPPPTQRFIDRFSQPYTLIVIGVNSVDVCHWPGCLPRNR